MYYYLKKKIIGILPILLGVTFITFFLLSLAPGDPVALKLASQGASLSQEALLELRREMGLDKSIGEQYMTWLLHLLRGDLGTSYVDNMPVADKLMKALPNTLLLSLSAISLTLVVSVPLGIYCAVRENRKVDKLVMGLTFLGSSVPNFFLSLLLVYVFALKLKLLPVLAKGTLEGLVLPTLALSLGLSSRYIRQVRGAVLEELKKPYVLGLRSRGVKVSTILFKNILPNVLVYLVTLIGLSVGSLLGGAAVVETIFVWRGLGKMVIDAISARDYPVVQGFVVVMAFIYVLVNTTTDLIYQKVNPKFDFKE